jgi:tetratricopeptide (TPR) repeat protein
MSDPQIPPPVRRNGKNRHRPDPAPGEAARSHFAMLGESEEAVALLLWSRLRAIQVWTGTSANRRELLVSANGQTAGALEIRSEALLREPALALAVETLDSLLSARVDVLARDVADACLLIAEWAAERGMEQTTVRFAETAAFADPESPRAAAVSGQACARLAEYSRAEEWLTRSATLARLARDHEWVARSHLRKGGMFFQLGDHERARRHYRRAFWSGRCWGHRRLGAMAAHDLFTLEAEVGTLDAALIAADRALDLYPARDPRIPYFASDCGYVLLRFGYFRSAYPILRDAAPLIPRADHAIVTGLIARAAGGLQNRAQLEGAIAQVRELVSATDRGAAAALVETAHGARLIQEWDLAAQLAEEGLRRAEARSEQHKATEARELLAGVEARLAWTPPEHTGRAARIPHLAERLVGVLRRNEGLDVQD